ncbi:MAG: hypothetical protein WDN46_23020 [Methylocella sp.]
MASAAERTKEEVRDMMEVVERLDLPDSEHWKMIADLLGISEESLFSIIIENSSYFEGHIDTD